MFKTKMEYRIGDVPVGDYNFIGVDTTRKILMIKLDGVTRYTKLNFFELWMIQKILNRLTIEQ